jgi:hypothetical protein
MRVTARWVLGVALVSVWLAGSLAGHAGQGVKVGATQDEVLKALGPPQGKMSKGGNAVWVYPTRMIEFRNGRVISGLTPAPANVSSGAGAAWEESPPGGSPSDALRTIMRRVAAVEDRASLEPFIDWQSALDAMAAPTREACGITTPSDLRDHCLAVLRKPTTALRRPLQGLIEAGRGENEAAVGRLEQALGRVDDELDGKIRGGFEFSGWGGERMEVGFCYYLNPDGTPNMEFDPTRNLSRNLGRGEDVSLP